MFLEKRNLNPPVPHFPIAIALHLVVVSRWGEEIDVGRKNVGKLFLAPSSASVAGVHKNAFRRINQTPIKGARRRRDGREKGSLTERPSNGGFHHQSDRELKSSYVVSANVSPSLVIWQIPVDVRSCTHRLHPLHRLPLPLSSDTSTNLSLSFFFPLLSNGGGKQSPAGKRIEKREKSFFSASLSPSFFSCHAASPRPGKNSVMGAPPHHLTQLGVCVLYDGNISEHTGLHRTIQHRGKREERMEGPVLLLPPPPIIPPFLPPSVRPPTATLNMQAYIHRPRTARVKGGGGGESCFSVLLLLRRGVCPAQKHVFLLFLHPGREDEETLF